MTTNALVRAASIDPATVRRVVLPNGLTVLIRRDESAPVVAIVTYVKAGYFDETDDVVGIAHVLEHMFFKGTAQRGVGEIAKETKASGGYLNAHTIYDHTSYYTVLPASGFAAGLAIQADAYANSVIEAGELGRELEVIIQEAKRKADNPSSVAVETLYELLHDTHRIRRWRIGREAGLRRLDRDAMLRFYRNFYRPSATILSIVGAVDPDEALRRVGDLYGAIPDATVERMPGPAESGTPGFRYREWHGDIAQTQLALGWRTPHALDPDTALLDLAAAVLGAGRASRLYRAVRERQHAASISAYNYTPTELGVFVIHAESPPEQTLSAARGVWTQLRELRETGIGGQELERAKRILEARWIRRLETMDGQANYLAEWEALGDWAGGDSYLTELLVATPVQVADAVRRHLVPGRAAVAVFRPSVAPAIAGDAAAFHALLEGERAAPLAPSPPRRPTPLPRPSPCSPVRIDGDVRVYETRLAVPILVRRKPGAPVTHFGVFALGGASDEGEERAGLTTLMARTMLKGTVSRTAEQIAEDAELLGGSIGVSVSVEMAAWTLSVPAMHTAAALELLADMVQGATMPEAALETERAVAIADVAMLRDDMYRYPMRLLMEGAFAGHPYGHSPLGTERTLQAITAADVRDRHRERVLRGQTVVAIVGDVPEDEMAAIAARDFGDLTMRAVPPLPPVTWPARSVAREAAREKAQSALALAFPAPARPDDARFAMHVLASIASGLGGRFFDELRDRQSLAYTVHAFSSERRLAGMFVSYIATSPEKEDTARAGLLAEFAKLRDAPVTNEELDRAKQYLVGSHAIRQQSGGAVLGDLVDAWLFGTLAELREHDRRVRAVRAEDIQALARRYFDPETRVEGIVRGVGKSV